MKHTNIDDCTTDDSTIDNTGAGGSNSTQLTNNELPKMYLRVVTLIEYDTFVATHGPGTCVDGKQIFF